MALYTKAIAREIGKIQINIIGFVGTAKGNLKSDASNTTTFIYYKLPSHVNTTTTTQAIKIIVVPRKDDFATAPINDPAVNSGIFIALTTVFTNTQIGKNHINAQIFVPIDKG